MTQEAFKGAVAASAGVPKDNVLITGERMRADTVTRLPGAHKARGACTLAPARSFTLLPFFAWCFSSMSELGECAVTEKTTSRRTSRKLLATVLEIAITILVKDKAAGDALVAGDGLKQTKLNEQLALQVYPLPFPWRAIGIVSACCGCLADNSCRQHALMTLDHHLAGSSHNHQDGLRAQNRGTKQQQLHRHHGAVGGAPRGADYGAQPLHQLHRYGVRHPLHPPLDGWRSMCEFKHRHAPLRGACVDAVCLVG